MTAVRGFFGHLGFVWNRNLWRLLLVLVVLTALIASSGTVAFIQSVFGIIASIPAFALPLSTTTVAAKASGLAAAISP